MRILTSPLLLVSLVSWASAAESGPFCQWHRDPCTTMAIQWIETTAEEGAKGEWLIGAAGFGYGDGDDQTVFADMEGNYRSVYIRRPYEIPAEAPEGAELILSIRYDDAFIAYLDGKEVARKGVEGAGSTVRNVQNHEADVWEQFPLGMAVAGAKGVVAIEGHNDKLDSSDFTLRPRLDAVVDGKPTPVVREGAKWAYLAGADPEADWTTTVGEAKVEGAPDVAAVPYRLAYRPAQGGDWTEATLSSRDFGPTASVVHSADLEGLQPGTRYEFRIARRGEEMGTWQFETAPVRFEEGTTFVTGGDMYHSRDRLDAMNTRAGKEDPLFALLGGDLAYANGTDSAKWLVWVDSWHKLAVAPDGRLIPMIVGIGNHEVKGAAYRPDRAPDRDQAPYFYSLFLGQEAGARFAIDFGDYLSVVGLDSGHTADIDKQTDWLEETLETRAKIPRLFVCYHRPAWGAGVKENATDIQDEWCPLFEKFEVDAVFENDHHVYKRTHPIVGKGEIDEERGILYLGDGSWGVGTRPIRQDWQERFPYLAEAKALNHLIKVTMTDTGFEYEAMTADGEVFDETERALRR